MNNIKKNFENDILFIDELTQIFNRRFFDRILPKILKDSRNCIFIIFDVDDFKKINDTYGHAAGDKALREVGKNLKELFHKENEFPIRYAGDEFAVVIFNIEKESAIEKVKKMFKKISNIEIKENSKIIKISISCGISFFPDDANSSEGLLKKADEGLYYVKKKGKNNFVIYREIAHKIEKEKILKSALTPPEIIGLQEEKEIINTGIERKKGIFIIAGPSGTGKTRLLKYAEKKSNKEGFLNIFCFTSKDDKNLPFNSIIRGITFWLDKEKEKILKSKNLDKYLHYFFTKSEIEELLEINVEEIFDFLEKLTSGFKTCFLIDDAENMDKHTAEFIELSRDKALFFLTAPDIKDLPSRIVEESVLISLTGISEGLIEEYIENLLPGLIYSPEFLSWLTQISNRNQFLIEEIMRYLIEREYIKISGENYQIEKIEEILSLKPSLFEITKERIKSLSKEDKILLYSLSIGERYFDIYTAAEYASMNIGRVTEIIEKLVEKQFFSKIYEDIYCFRNNRVKNMIYNGIEENIKKKLHLRMAKTLERTKFMPKFLNLAEIMKHYNIAGEVKKARETADKINSILQKLKRIPDLKRLKKIKRKSRLKSEIEFVPLKREILHAIESFLKKFFGAIEAVRIYPPESSIILQRVKETQEILKKILMVQKNIILGLHSGRLIINEFELPENKAYIKRIKELFEDLGLESIIFTEEIDEESLKKLISFTKRMKELVIKGESIEDFIEKFNLKGVFVNERVYIAVGSEYGEIFEFEKVDAKSMENLGELPEIPSLRSELKPSQMEEERKKLEKLLKQPKKLKEFVGKILLELHSNVLKNQKEAFDKLEEIYPGATDEIKNYISEEIINFYTGKAFQDIKEYMKGKIFKYLERVIKNIPEKALMGLKKEPTLIFDHFNSLILLLESLKENEKNQLENLLVEICDKRFEKFVEICEGEVEKSHIVEEVLERKLKETRGNILAKLKKNSLILKSLEIIEKKKIPINTKILFEIYSKNKEHGILRKTFQLLIQNDIEIMKGHLEECIKKNNYEGLKKFLDFLGEIPETSFLPLLIKIIEKRKIFQRELPYEIQLKALEILKKLPIKHSIKEIAEIAKKRKFFSLTRDKPSYIRLEILKLLAIYLQEKNVLKIIKSFEKDREPSIKFFVRSIIKDYGKE